MYPHERSLVKKLADKPFTILGVNSDTDLKALKETLEKEEITWRSFWNGKKGPSGPIAEAWNVHSWPTLFVIDHKGVIRHKNLRDPELMEKAIEKLVVEAEKDAKSGR